MDTELKCSTCKQIKPISEFHVDMSVKRGYSYVCKTCRLQHKQKPTVKERINQWERDHREDSKRRRRGRRIKAIKELGGICECCGETRLEFLAIDHIDGLTKRSKSDSGDGLIGSVAKSGYSKEKYRVLCHNCNSALGFYGYCPHKTEKDFLTR